MYLVCKFFYNINDYFYALVIKKLVKHRLFLFNGWEINLICVFCNFKILSGYSKTQATQFILNFFVTRVDLIFFNYQAIFIDLNKSNNDFSGFM